MSFVNSIATTKGGTHVNHVLDQLVGRITEAVRKKRELKDVKFKPNVVKNHLWVFLNCLIENPAFDSQTKESLTLRQSEFGSSVQFNSSFINKGIFFKKKEKSLNCHYCCRYMLLSTLLLI